MPYMRRCPPRVPLSDQAVEVFTRVVPAIAVGAKRRKAVGRD